MSLKAPSQRVTCSYLCSSGGSGLPFLTFVGASVLFLSLSTPPPPSSNFLPKALSRANRTSRGCVLGRCLDMCFFCPSNKAPQTHQEMQSKITCKFVFQFPSHFRKRFSGRNPIILLQSPPNHLSVVHSKGSLDPPKP